jgi:hypothetical protein
MGGVEEGGQGVSARGRHHFDNKGKLPVRAHGKNALMDAHRKSKRGK